MISPRQPGMSQGQARPKPVAPIRTDKKIGRNEIVTIKRGNETKSIKYKKAEIFLTQGWQIHDVRP